MEREEWMMMPGERDPFAAGADVSSTIAAALTNRKFQTGKLAKKAAEAVELYKEHARDQADDQLSEEAEATQALLDEYRAQRGPSLMDQHMEQKKGSGKVGSQFRPKGMGKGERKHERKAFNHDEVWENLDPC